MVGCAYAAQEDQSTFYIPYLIVHPDWQCAAIGTRLQYRLIETIKAKESTSKRKDLTLHVSATNQAFLLYHFFFQSSFY